MKKTTTHLYDILGISSATVCLVHCLVFPLLTILPLGLNHNPFIDLIFAIIGCFAIFKIIKKSNLLVATVLLISMVLIWISVLSEIILDIHLDLIFIGGTGMIIGHFLNYKSHRNRNH
ncbi:MerC domain-containing protein [Flavobacterium sp. N1736]|uniref:MerC domain-containing protein n=1 Tax=Flavobacterium sp. N1736 TaxID=2986823 RepID=UPI0022245711|nr:MerC domain-containing protein [Flavobacterium sp. N1736]